MTSLRAGFLQGGGDVTAMVADRNQLPQTNLALDALGICLVDALCYSPSGGP
jgi:hypothetical protein